MRLSRSLLLPLLLAGCATLPPADATRARAAPALHQQLELFAGWLAGEWDNHEQAWLSRQPPPAGQPAAPAVARLHQLFAPVELPILGTHLFYVQHYAGDRSDQLLGEHLYSLSIDPARAALRLDLHVPIAPGGIANLHRDADKRARLDRTDLDGVPACAVYWRFDVASQSFAGQVDHESCRRAAHSAGLAPLLARSYRLAADTLDIEEVAPEGRQAPPPLRSRKVRHFDGWAVIGRRGPATTGSAEADFRVVRPIRVHDAGQQYRLAWEDGKATGYSLELARLTYPGQAPILRLALVDHAADAVIAYSWASPDASRIGLNLGWLQAGFTLEGSE